MEIIVALLNRLNGIIESSGLKSTVDNNTYCRIYESCLLLVNDRLSTGMAVKLDIECGFYDDEIKKEIDHWSLMGKLNEGSHSSTMVNYNLNETSKIKKVFA